MEEAHRDKRVCVEGVSSQTSDGSQHLPQIEGGEDDGHAADIEEYQWKDPIKQTYSEVVQSMTQLFNDSSQLQKAVVQTQKSVSRMKECDPQFGESDLQSLLQSSFLVLQHEVSGLQRSISRLQETAAKTTAGEQPQTSQVNTSTTPTGDAKPTIPQISQAVLSDAPPSDRQPAIPQLDGPQDYRPQMIPAGVYRQDSSMNHKSTASKSRNRRPKTAINDILPYCTAEMPLTQNQVVALSDIAGNLKEVMLLALQARVDEHVASELVRAVGPDAAKGIVDFFSDEFEAGGF